ncbi:coiled-coil-helix-coiled-coil-helix domain containing 3a isoform X1 [Pangasianodon hypophthalmus]|uniref:coiled-coil-helix-coiled-coil-helix domain containing 3a isoform X1 n=1 Tax=Pangasianodon hypophthalmus TaxID=310915 RepID=UPI00230833F6|nr:coiled-coil-helix-coiled-coil-helix domain containing 3a isoform X1 [Pangasianodon hypophthalmus]
MGGSSSTRRVSFESDENENVTVVKGVRLSENVINRMREPSKPQSRSSPPPPPQTKVEPQPYSAPSRPAFDPITSLPPQIPAPPPTSPPPASAPAAEAVDPASLVAPPPPPPPLASEPPPPPSVAVATPLPVPVPSAPLPHKPSPPPCVEITAPCATPADPATPPAEPAAPAAPSAPSLPLPILEEPVIPPSTVDESELRRKISEEVQKGLEEERSKTQHELHQWLEKERARVKAQAHADAQAHVQDEVNRILASERAAALDSVQRAVVRERVSAEEERLRTKLLGMACKAKQLEERDQQLRKQDAFYREQLNKLEERSTQFYKVTNENYHKAADEVNAKFRRYEISPVCADLQGQILKCYRENAGKTLLCSNIASLYLQCVNSAKQNKLRTGG